MYNLSLYQEINCMRTGEVIAIAIIARSTCTYVRSDFIITICVCMAMAA